jgi:GT2 family glycosyltransferase
MKYSIVIPTYNHCSDLLIPCIDAIFEYTNIQDIELVVSANGCTDDTFDYLFDLAKRMAANGLSENLKVVWHNEALGYAKAVNAAVRVSTTDNIVLLNNDAFLLPQHKNAWLTELESRFISDPSCGISGVIDCLSPFTNRMFVIFFCVMIKRAVFDKIGLLNEEYGIGGGEDTEFCFEAEQAGFTLAALNNSWYPLYHAGEGTMHDGHLSQEQLLANKNKNEAIMAKKYNPSLYQSLFNS